MRPAIHQLPGGVSQTPSLPAQSTWRLLISRALAVAVGGATVLLVWSSQYFVDAEVTLLPWLMSRGWALYRDIVDHHSPLLPALLVPLAGAGDPGLPLRLAIVSLLALTLTLTYALAARLAGTWGGVVALLIAGLWLPPFEATHLWYDGALAPVYLGAALLLLFWKASTDVRQRSWLTFGLGVLLGTGTLIKQHAAVAAVAIGVALLSAGFTEIGRAARYPTLFVLGTALPIAAVGVLFAWQGTLSDAWYWIVSYNLSGEYGSAAMPPSANEWPILAALYAPIVALAILYTLRLHKANGRPERGRGGMLWPAAATLGILLAATLPAWSRYARHHFQAAIPLVAVAGGVSAVWLLRETWTVYKGARNVRAIVASSAAALLLGLNLLIGGSQWSQTVSLQQMMGAPQAPYSSTAPAIRAWVDRHAPAQAPIFIYGVDQMLYRVLEREPPRPWVPQFPWLLKGGIEERFWQGAERARPPVILLTPGLWEYASDLQLSPVQRGTTAGLAWLRRHYHEAERFQVVNYPKAPAVEVLGLLRNDGTSP